MPLLPLARSARCSSATSATALRASLTTCRRCSVLGKIYVMVLQCHSNYVAVYSLILDCAFGCLALHIPLFGCKAQVAQQRTPETLWVPCVYVGKVNTSRVLKLPHPKNAQFSLCTGGIFGMVRTCRSACCMPHSSVRTISATYSGGEPFGYCCASGSRAMRSGHDSHSTRTAQMHAVVTAGYASRPRCRGARRDWKPCRTTCTTHDYVKSPK